MSTTYIHAPSGPHTHTMILLHGRDSIASEFASEFFESQASDDHTLPEIFPSVKWVFPSSKLRTSSRFGVEMSQWFDIWSVENPSEKEEIQVQGLKESVRDVMKIIEEEVRLVGNEKVFLGGISQGCATAIYALWRIADVAKDFPRDHRGEKVRWLFGNPALPSGGSSNLQTPVFLTHSKDDEVVPVENGGLLHSTLVEFGFTVNWKVYPDGGHWVNEPQGVDDIVNFLTSNL